MAFAAQSIDHVEVFVRSIPGAIVWYGRVLGLEVTARWDPEPIMIGAGGTQLALFQAPAGAEPSPDARPPLRWHRVAWKTDRNPDRSSRTGVIYHYTDMTGTQVATLPLRKSDLHWVIVIPVNTAPLVY